MPVVTRFEKCDGRFETVSSHLHNCCLQEWQQRLRFCELSCAWTVGCATRTVSYQVQDNTSFGNGYTPWHMCMTKRRHESPMGKTSS